MRQARDLIADITCTSYWVDRISDVAEHYNAILCDLLGAYEWSFEHPRHLCRVLAEVTSR